MSRNRGVRFEKQPSEDTQLMAAMASSSVSSRPASEIVAGSGGNGDKSSEISGSRGNSVPEQGKWSESVASSSEGGILERDGPSDIVGGNSGNSIPEGGKPSRIVGSGNLSCVSVRGKPSEIIAGNGQNNIPEGGKLEEEDRQSLCEEAIECTVVSDNITNEEESAPQVSESNITSVEQTVRRCKSVPNVLELCKLSDVRERSLTVTGWWSGSKTLPCSPSKYPSRSCSTVFSSSEPSTSLSEALPLSPCSKLSPSVLEIDYTSEQQSDVDHGQPAIQKCNRNWRPVAASNGVITKKAVIVQEESNMKIKSVAVKRTATIASSGSSDTLNLETNKSSDESILTTNRPSMSKETPIVMKPSVRPNELKLPARSWGETREETKRQHKNGVIGSAPEYAGEWLSDNSVVLGCRPYKKSFIEDGGNSVLPMATGFFPRPLQGQSLTSFLSSGQFARPSAELDRENAHFSISEAMIAAIEQVKCNRQLRVAEERGEVGDESDEEINHLKQRIRLRRRQRQQEKQSHLWGVSLLSDGKTDTTTTDQSVSPLSSSPGTPSDSISTDDVDDLEVDEVQNLAQLKNSGLSVSMASLYSEADLSKHPPPRTGTDLALTESVVSAEGVALSLLRQFSEKQLPRASDLQWLVSEQDAPQQLLPLPTSWPVSPDEAEDTDMRQATPLRGTMEWAPPRPQVIFTLHPSPVLYKREEYYKL